jgi:hypothetical protein
VGFFVEMFDIYLPGASSRGTGADRTAVGS